MTIDELLHLLKASQSSALTPLQELVLRSSWEGKTYTNIAIEAHYGEERIRKVASKLWQLLSEFSGEPINKANFREILEPRHLTKAQQQLIEKFYPPASTSLEFPTGPVSLDSSFYIARPPIEELAFAEIGEPGSIIRIKAPRKMGKSSLLLRILAHAATLGFRSVTLDFQQADTAVFNSFDKFLRWFSANVSRQLQLESRLDKYWDEDIGSKVSCTIYFQEYLLPSVNSPLVLALNEVNLLFEYPEIAKDFLPLLRYWYEQAKHEEIWQKLRLIVAYSTEIYLPLKVNQSPFNIGLPLKLPPFTKEQVEELALRHGMDWIDGDYAERLMAMVGGHPHLVRLALYHLSHEETTLEQLLQKAPTDTGIYNEHLGEYLLALQEDPEIGVAFKQVISADSPVKLEPILADKLNSLGLVNLAGDRVYPSCELYRLYFREKLLEKDGSDSSSEELKKENQELRRLFSLDELTQFANRRYFNSYLQIEWKRSSRTRTPLSVILCDIDYFKIYNKTYGYPAGDDCLRQIAVAIRECVQTGFTPSSFSSEASIEANNTSERNSSILVARYSGEEFALLLPQIDAVAAVYLAENIREQVKALAISCNYPGIGGLPASVLTVSLGVASIIPEHEGDPVNLLRAAEQALYQSKRKGRDRVTLS